MLLDLREHGASSRINQLHTAGQEELHDVLRGWRWILEKKGGSLDTAAVKELNNVISGYIFPDEMRASICSDSGIPDDGSIKDIISLNNLDDWSSFHKAMLS